MWWSRQGTGVMGRAGVKPPGVPSSPFALFARAIAAVSAAVMLAGCFQPLYGEHSVGGGPGIRQRLAGVDVIPISAPNGTPEARIAVELRNALLFDLQGGGGSSGATHQLRIQMASTRQQVIVDIVTARPGVEQYGINASYTLTEIATNKPVLTGQTFARVSYDIPGQQQRFARVRGLRDAENRAAKVIAENIRSRLASYFVAGT